MGPLGSYIGVLSPQMVPCLEELEELESVEQATVLDKWSFLRGISETTLSEEI